MRKILLTIVLVLVAVSSYAFNFASFDFVGGNRKCTDLLPNPVFSPTSKAFGEKDTGTTTDQIFTLSNSGTAPLSAASLAVTGTSFTLQSTTCGSNPFDLAVGADCIATVRFAPLTAAAFTGSLTMSAVNLDDVVASLSGTGISAGDGTPNAFSFTDQTDVALSSTITSAAITVAGIDTTSAISVSGGTYDINASGTFTASSSTVNNGDTVRARHTSSASNSTAVNTVVTIGGVSDTFTSTTVAASSLTTPTALWAFENDATDSIGDIDLTNNGSITYSSTSPPEGSYFALAPNSTSQNFSAADTDTLDIGQQDYSMSFWVRRDRDAITIYKKFLQTAGNGGLTVTATSSDTLTVAHGVGSAGVITATLGTTSTDQWYLVTYAYDYSANSITAWISQASFGDVVNGASVAMSTYPAASTAGPVIASTTSAFATSNGIDDLAIWIGYTLTATEAESIFNGGLH